MGTREPLNNETRRRIFEYINQNPGIHLRAIARGVELDTNHTKYHLIHLEQCGLINSERVHGHWAFFPGNPESAELEGLDESDRALLFLIRKKVPRRVVEELIEIEEATHKQLQEAAGVSASTLYYHLRRMEEKEVILSRKVHRARYWRLRSPTLAKRFLELSEKPQVVVEADGSQWTSSGEEEVAATAGRANNGGSHVRDPTDPMVHIREKQ